MLVQNVAQEHLAPFASEPVQTRLAREEMGAQPYTATDIQSPQSVELFERLVPGPQDRRDLALF